MTDFCAADFVAASCLCNASIESTSATIFSCRTLSRRVFTTAGRCRILLQFPPQLFDLAFDVAEDITVSMILDAIKANGGVVQTVEFHVSCSQPLALGDEFGSFKLVEFTTKAGTSVALGSGDPGPYDACSNIWIVARSTFEPMSCARLA